VLAPMATAAHQSAKPTKSTASVPAAARLFPAEELAKQSLPLISKIIRPRRKLVRERLATLWRGGISVGRRRASGRNAAIGGGS